MVARTPDYQQGQTIPGTVYCVHRLLGSGGMGTVYEVEDTTVGRRYVLKTLHGNLAERADLAARLSREARALAKLQHLNIVEVYTSGTTQDQLHLPYYVMERLDGQSLRTILQRKGRLPLEQALDLACDLLDALDHAHEHGIVHRDVKPDNIFVVRGRDGRSIAKLLDFGIAKLTQRTNTVQTAGFLGTFRYAAPEQILGREITPQTDLYSAALVIYEMVAGRGPFDDLGSEVDIGKAHVDTTPPLLSRFGPVPAELERLVATMLAKNVQDRPPDSYSVGQSLREMKRILQGGSTADVHEKATVAAAVSVLTNVPEQPQSLADNGAQTRALPPEQENGAPTRVLPAAGTPAVPVTVASGGTVAPATSPMAGAPPRDPQGATRYDNTRVSPAGADRAAAGASGQQPPAAASTLPLSMRRPPELDAALSQYNARSQAAVDLNVPQANRDSSGATPFAQRDASYSGSLTPVPSRFAVASPNDTNSGSLASHTKAPSNQTATKVALLAVLGALLLTAFGIGVFLFKRRAESAGAAVANTATAAMATQLAPPILSAPVAEGPAGSQAPATAIPAPTAPLTAVTAQPTGHTHHGTTTKTADVPSATKTAPVTSSTTPKPPPPPTDTGEATHRVGSGL